eukprot:TRINITY_DN1673_c0_g1_i1.p1 TRINITY_DN1673_c0_g1~~TRINITY_DN1673_c0_g1_i1.p1  ORF type:complete len:115 (+),score=13.09 TRINITY_DN1673_c0_g1_i1:238-582(+)
MTPEEAVKDKERCIAELIEIYKRRNLPEDQWYLDTYRHWYRDDGFTLLVLNRKRGLILGCIGAHPFALSDWFRFSNSDGSSDWVSIPPTDPHSPKTILAKLQKDIVSYLVRPIH